MSAKMTGEQLGAKIADARHEAEGLKDRIKRRKDELADTTRKEPLFSIQFQLIPAGVSSMV